MGEGGELERLTAEADTARLTLRTASRASLIRATQARAHDLLDTIAAAIEAGDADGATAILCGFFVPLIESDHAVEAETQLAGLLSREAELRDPARRFQLHEVAYVEAFLKGQDSADDHCSELFSIAEATGSDDLLARALTARCRLGLRDEDAASVEADAAALAALGERLDDRFHAGFAPHMLASLREMQDRPAEAVDLFVESSRLFGEAGADHLLLTEVFNLAACRLDLGHLDAARDGFLETYLLMQQLDNHHLEPELLSCLATWMCDAGAADTAARLVGASQAALRRHDRALYPSEAKAADRTRHRLEQALGQAEFEVQRLEGLTRTLDATVDLVRLGPAPAP